MICLLCDCNAKMKCCHSVPAGARLTARTYRCPECGNRLETIELPLGLMETLDIADQRAIIIRFRAEKSKHLNLLKRIREKKRATGEVTLK